MLGEMNVFSHSKTILTASNYVLLLLFDSTRFPTNGNFTVCSCHNWEAIQIHRTKYFEPITLQAVINQQSYQFHWHSVSQVLDKVDWSTSKIWNLDRANDFLGWSLIFS